MIQNCDIFLSFENGNLSVANDKFPTLLSLSAV